MLARCGAQIRIEVIDRATRRLCDSDLSDIFLEVSHIDNMWPVQALHVEPDGAGFRCEDMHAHACCTHTLPR